ncbi:MAG: ABC transporter permease subunit [Promicromonosporaceae bacterium]|nr:ABC transporter permease subunit [Promicromonosporaceae bacterium]
MSNLSSQDDVVLSDYAAPVAVAAAPAVATVVERPVAVMAERPVYHSAFAGENVNFGRMLKSEWIKFWSLRSTWWVLALTIVLMAGLALMFAAVMRTTLNDPATLAAMAEMGGEGAGAGGGGFMGGFSAVTVVTLGLQFAQLTVAVLGVLMITNEYSSGMIRATLSAAPRRGRVLLAKLTVLLSVTALTAIIGLALAWLVTRPVLDGVAGITPVDFADATDLRALGGAVLYLMAIATLSLGIGSLIRATAGAIFTVVSVLMVLPMIFQIILLAANATWAQTINRYLPSVAGERVFSTIEFGGAGMMGMMGEQLTPWVGFAVLAGYAIVAFVAAILVMRRRDA